MYKNFTKKNGIPNRYISKILHIMKLTAIILFASMMQVSASTFGQKVTLVQKNISFEKVFREIKKQTGYNVVYFDKKLNGNSEIDVSFKDTPLSEVMDRILEGKDLTFSFNKTNVVIKEKSFSIIDKIKEVFSNIDVSGRLVDKDGNAISGATITIKGTNRSVISNSSGYFNLANIDESSILMISYVGYTPLEVLVKVNLGSIVLASADSKLEEVNINAGYYRTSDKERTGSIAKLTSVTIEKQPVNNVLMAMQNRLPGVEITQLNGVPGGGFTVMIRGRNSIGSGNDPLYIIDGVIYPSNSLSSNSDVITQGVNPLSLISPNDISSIEVLKDADATAIYGSRGANGVVLITTKKGVSGKTVISASISQGISEVGHKMNLLNTDQYINMRLEALKNDGLKPNVMDYDVNGTWDKSKYTDWQNLFIGNVAPLTNVAASVSGGNDESSYLFASNFSKEGTVFPGDFGLKRGNVRMNMNFGSVGSKVKGSFNANYGTSTSNLMTNDPTINIFRAPNAPNAYDEFGNLLWYYNNVNIPINPMSGLLNTTNANTDNLIGNAVITYQIIKTLSLKVSAGYSSIKREELIKAPNSARNPAYNPTSDSRTTSFVNIENNSWIAEPQLVYEANIGPGKLNSLLGMSFQMDKKSYREIIASNFNSDALMENIASASVFGIGQNTFTSYKYAAIFSRINYNMYDKYYLNLTGRRDASSRFGPGRQIGNFGAIGTAWIFSNENLIKNNLHFLSFGKLRASYGVTGNDQINDYQYIQLYNSSSSYQGTNTLITSRIANNNFGWETNKKSEVAMQLGLFKDRTNIEIAYFRNRSSNQLVGLPLPPSVGATSIQANSPATVQNTGWEFQISNQIINNKNFEWTADLNLTIPKNKLVAFADLSASSYATEYIIGKPLNIRRYYNTSVDPKTGAYTWDDLNGNGLQDDVERYLNTFIGQKYYGGIHNSFKYKAVEFDFLISFSKQTGSSLLSNLFTIPGAFTAGGFVSNLPTMVLGRWQQQGDLTEIPKFTTSNYDFYIGSSSFDGKQGISDLSFARLKNVSLKLNLPKRFLSKIGITSSSISLQGQNLITITKYQGLDPETTGIRVPPLRTYILGLNLSL